MSNPISSKEIADRYAGRGKGPISLEEVNLMYQLRDQEVADLAQRKVIYVKDIQKLERTGRSKVAVELFAQCDEEARNALMNDEHHFVRSCAFISNRELGSSCTVRGTGQVCGIGADMVQTETEVEASASWLGSKDFSGPQFVHGGWSHIFADGKGPDTTLRFVFDRVKKRIVAMEIKKASGWRKATSPEIADVEDSLKTANDEAIESPEDWGLEESELLPVWAANS